MDRTQQHPARTTWAAAGGLVAAGALAAGVMTAAVLAVGAPAGSPVAAFTSGGAAADAVPGTGGGIGPGAELITELDGGYASCTANFVYTGGSRVYLGSAAHCHSLGESIDGCANRSLPLGTPVVIRGLDGQQYTAHLAYSSWETMQRLGETDESLCMLNDLALLEIDPADVDRIDPSVPQFGGPTGLTTGFVPAGERVFSYQNDEEEPPYPVMRAKQGVNLGGADGSGRGYVVQTTTPGLPGDSGSGYLDGSGRAMGVLSTEIVLSGGEIVNGVTALAPALDYAATTGGIGPVDVVEGGTFSPDGVPMDELPQRPLDPRRLLERGLDLLRSVLGAR